MHAPPKQDVPIITAAELPEARKRSVTDHARMRASSRAAAPAADARAPSAAAQADGFLFGTGTRCVAASAAERTWRHGGCLHMGN
jgi:hypothetical protein